MVIDYQNCFYMVNGQIVYQHSLVPNQTVTVVSVKKLGQDIYEVRTNERVSNVNRLRKIENPLTLNIFNILE